MNREKRTPLWKKSLKEIINVIENTGNNNCKQNKNIEESKKGIKKQGKKKKKKTRKNNDSKKAKVKITPLKIEVNNTSDLEIGICSPDSSIEQTTCAGTPHENKKANPEDHAIPQQSKVQF